MAAEEAEPADHGLQPRMLAGVLVGLAVIPFSIVYRARVFALRSVSNWVGLVIGLAVGEVTERLAGCRVCRVGRSIVHASLYRIPSS